MINIILSIEGDESNTERNFYTGAIRCLCLNKCFKFASIHNYKKSSGSNKSIKGWIKNIIIKNNKENKKIKFFVISDLDANDQMESIKFTFNTIKEFINEFEDVFIHEEIIGDDGKSFDHLLPQSVKQKNIHKKFKFKNLFYKVAVEREWFNTEDEIIFEKWKKDFKESKHTIILEEMRKYA